MDFVVPFSLVYPVKSHASRARLLALERARVDLMTSCSQDEPVHLVAAEARLSYAVHLVALQRGLAAAPKPVLLTSPEVFRYPTLALGPLRTDTPLETNQLRVELLFAATALTVSVVQQKPGPAITPRMIPLLKHTIAVLTAIQAVVEDGWFDRGNLRDMPVCLVDPLSVRRHLAALHISFEAHLLTTEALKRLPAADRLGQWAGLVRHLPMVVDYPYLAQWVRLGLAETLVENDAAWPASTSGARWQAKEWLYRVQLKQPLSAKQCVDQLAMHHMRQWTVEDTPPPPLQPYYCHEATRELYVSPLLEPEVLPPTVVVKIGTPKEK